MNFLVDAQLPIALCRWLECKGHGAVHVADIGLTGADDETMLAGGERLIEVR